MSLKGIADLLQQFAPRNGENYDKSNKSQTRNLNASEVFDFLTLAKQWHEIVGQKLAIHTIPVKNSNGVLTVLTDHPVYGQELSFLHTPIIKKIEMKFPLLKGKVKRLNFQNDPVFFKVKVESLAKMTNKPTIETKEKEATRYHQHSPEYKAAKAEATEQFQNIDDLEAREAMISLYVQFKLS